MSKFCTGCGSPLISGAYFCTSCGKKVETVIFPEMKTKKRKPLWAKLVIAGLISAVILVPAGYGVWKAGEITGFWNNRALAKASAEWKKQPDIKTEEREIFLVLEIMKLSLASGDIDTAMSQVHPLAKDDILVLFTDYKDKIPDFTNALENLELLYLSEDPGYFAEDRVAKVMAGTPSDTEPVTGISYIFLVKTENGWVVEKIL